MKIIQASSYFYPHIGGVETHVFELSRTLQDMGHDVIVLCARVPKSRTYEVVNGLPTHRFPALDLPYVPFMYGLRRRIARFDADVIHSHYPPPFLSYGAVRGLPQLPHLLTYHCDLIIPDKVGNLRIPHACKNLVELAANGLYTRPILNRVNRIIATTKSYAQSSSVLCNYPYEIVPNGIMLKTFDANLQVTNNERRAKQVLFVGRLSSVKGIDTLIEAAKIVLKEHREATFIIVGDGEERYNLRALAKDYQSRIKFYGHVSKRCLLALYRSSTVLVLPSFTRLEAFGVVLLEAMASETPVIASYIPGVLDVVGDGGLLVTPRHPQSLAAAILEIFEDPTKARSMGRNGRKRVEQQYDWKIVAQKIFESYVTIVESMRA